MQLQAKLIQTLPVETGTSASGKEWQKVTAIVETPGQYPKKIAIAFFNKAIDSLTGLRSGQTVIFHIDIESREHQGRWYTSVTCFKAEPDVAPQARTQSPAPQPQGFGSYPQPGPPRPQGYGAPKQPSPNLYSTQQQQNRTQLPEMGDEDLPF